MMRRGAIVVVSGAVTLALSMASCGASEPNDLPAPPPSTSGASRPTTATTARAAVAATTSVPTACGPTEAGSPDTASTDTTPTDTGTPDTAGRCGTAPDASPSTTPGDSTSGATTPGSNPTPRLNSLTAYLTSHFGEEPWRSQLSDYNLSTAGDTFQLTIKVRSTLDVNQAVDACTAVAKWSTSTFADGTISITDSSGKDLAATSSARNRACAAS
jgi:hypothetical protein